MTITINLVNIIAVWLYALVVTGFFNKQLHRRYCGNI